VLGCALALAIASCDLTEVPVPIALSIRISSTGECTVTKVTMPCEGVGAFVKGLNAQPGCDIHIQVDRESQYEYVTTALRSLQKAGFKKIGFADRNP
jgi:biopolymer transport protein ExbD